MRCPNKFMLGGLLCLKCLVRNVAVPALVGLCTFAPAHALAGMEGKNQGAGSGTYSPQGGGRPQLRFLGKDKTASIHDTAPHPASPHGFSP